MEIGYGLGFEGRESSQERRHQAHPIGSQRTTNLHEQLFHRWWLLLGPLQAWKRTIMRGLRTH